ncbi:peptidylprolyl isomerase [Acidomonas methanolica]|uniref:Parvulin-like PPIase n=3 Tax=Acidomonas methanolica TaxID=437 RepID=A0A023D0Y4_ACIMT|nr:peptidylprolyl isomerase [Acidomonas methanolica]TCS32339.1 peptidyl-prolyl cis-trans isomerase D [Acidomonas methanolica]GAJ27714.1 peptidyl-prolyl cis-trans isomerase [Acidomonas methanolica NBRC 104435]GEK97776.1 hypothetical protein AME01nite_02750 [Acidomonas methanolica NBRC 104435]
MITALRRVFVDSWLGRAIALIFFAAFVVWGMGGIATNMGGSSTAVVKIGPRSITPEALERALSSQLPQIARQMGVSDPSQLPQSERAQVAREVLQRMITQQELLVQATRNGMNAPDSLVRRDVFDMPYFKGKDGRFDRAVFNQRIAQIGMNEAAFLDMVREDIVVRGLGGGLGDAATAPEALVRRIVDFNARRTVLDLVAVDAAKMPAPPAPDEAELHRYYDNHPWEFSTPEFRHAKMVVLTADTVARQFEVSDADLKRLYDFQSQRFHAPETRHLEVLTFQDQAAAARAATAWKAGASWEAMRTQFPDAAAVDMPDTRKADLPSPELAAASFAAPQGDIQGPVKSETGWVIFRVIDIKAPHDTSFADAREDLRKEIAKAQAPQLLPARVQQLQDAVAGSTDLERIPANVGAAPASGFLNAQGLTKDGEPAPIPGDADLRKQIVARIFAQGTKDHPTVVEGPKGSAFAVLVDVIEPGHVKPFDTVRAEVEANWTADARRHAADRRAAALLVKARAGTGVAAAVAETPEAADLKKDIAFSRAQPPQLPRVVAMRAFETPVGKSFMVNDGDLYFVATVTGLRDPDTALAKEIEGRVETQMTDTLREDVSMAYVRQLEDRLKPQPNMALLRKVIDSTGVAAGGH